MAAAAAVPFDEFYEAEYTNVVRLAVALTGRADVAEELAQDAFVAAYRRWPGVSRYDDPAGWVRRVVTNRCISSGRRYVAELRSVATLGRHRSRQEDPAGLVDDELWAVVRALPRRQAQVIALAFVEDRSVRDIASILGCGEETVRTHLRRGRRTIAERLGVEDTSVHGGDGNG